MTTKAINPSNSSKSNKEKVMSTCSNGVSGCEHNKVRGAAAVEAFAEARFLQNVCSSRMTFLREKAMSFHAWLEGQPDTDATAVCQGIVKRVERELKANGPDPLLDKPDDELPDTLVDCAGQGSAVELIDEVTGSHVLDYGDRNEIESLSTEELEAHMESVVNKSCHTPEARLYWYDKQLAKLNEELALHDRIQLGIEGIPDINCSAYDKANELANQAYSCTDGYERKAILQAVKQWRSVGSVIKKAFQFIDRQRNLGRLSYTGWFLFNNQLMEKLGRSGLEWPEAYGELHLLADSIAFYEGKREEAKQAIAENAAVVTGAQLEPEGYVELFEEIEQFVVIS